jgi:hypothetical protein
MATTALPDLIERREHRLHLNLTARELEALDRLAIKAGARTRAQIGRALLNEALQRHLAVA